MTPRLVAIDGPLKGSTFAISSPSFSVGRKADNTLSAADLSISRHHCTIGSASGQYCLIDHDSQNGTFLNGIPIKERLLAHGDRITVGASVFVFLLGDEVSENPAAAPPLRHRIIGESPAIQHALDFVARVAPLASTVLITGEKGAGKQLLARALHDNGPRSEKPFVTVHCTALSETLLDCDLFGEEPGGWTSAVNPRAGQLELADGGTLFLDEVAELSPTLQAKLLRLLQEKKFERVGGNRTRTADLCVIAATCLDLSAARVAGAFRADLYFRLCVLSMALPPLRERREDIPLLANYFRMEESARQKRRVRGITAAARECLLRYDWPGNVSELRSAIASAVALGSTEGILPEDLPESVLPCVGVPDEVLPRFQQELMETKRELILKAYQQAHGSNVHAAAQLGLHPNSLLRLVRCLGLQEAVRTLDGSGK